MRDAVAMGWGAQARQQAGVIARAQLYEFGLSADQVDRMVTAGELDAVHRGVHIVHGAPLTYEARLWSATLAIGGVLGFATAAHLWGLVDDAPPRINVIAARGARVQIPAGIRLHRIDLRPGTSQRRHGLAVTSRLTTALDHLGRLSGERADDFADRAIQQGWLRRSDIEYRFRSQPGRTGNVTLRRVFDLTEDRAAAKSERILHAILRRGGITRWVANHDVWANGMLLGVVDVALVEFQIAIELDGRAHHVNPDRFQRDRRKNNALTTAGWTVLRFTWGDVTRRPGYVISTIRTQIATNRSDSGELSAHIADNSPLSG
jgi:very-short-patch-repair endonuclease